MLNLQRERERAASSRADKVKDTAPFRISLPPWWQPAIAITAVVIAVLAVMHGQEWVTQMKNLRGRWVAVRAQRMIDEGRHDAAVAVMLDAFERSPDEPVVVRTLAIAAAAKHPEQAKYLFERLDRLEAATADDHIRLAKVMSLLNDKSGADALLRKTSYASSADIGFWRTRGEVDASAGRVRESQAAYEKALTLSPGDADASIGLGTLLASSSDRARVAQGVDILLAELHQAVEARRSKSVTRALESLSFLPIPYTSQRVRLARIIEQMPVKTLGQSVLGRLMDHPFILSDEQRIQRADEIRPVIYGHRALSVDAKEEAVAILQAHGEHGIVLEWLSSGHGDIGPRLYAQRIDSLMATARWREAADLAGRAESPLGDATRKLLLALIHLRQSGGKAPDAEPLLAEALARAS
jgi:tetratricopeptide (TPR) repeat protein